MENHKPSFRFNTPRTNVARSGLTSAKTRNFHSSIYYKMLICHFPSSSSSLPLSSSLHPTPWPLRLICVSFISVSMLMNCSGFSRENAYDNKALGMAEARIWFGKWKITLFYCTRLKCKSLLGISNDVLCLILCLNWNFSMQSLWFWPKWKATQ